MQHIVPLKPGDKVYVLFWSAGPFFYMEATLRYYSNINAVYTIKNQDYDQEQTCRAYDVVPKTKENLAILKEMRKLSEAENKKLLAFREKLKV
jgi:hypothetical protein